MCFIYNVLYNLQKKYIFVKKFFDRNMQRKSSNNYESYNIFLRQSFLVESFCTMILCLYFNAIKLNFKLI